MIKKVVFKKYKKKDLVRFVTQKYKKQWVPEFHLHRACYFPQQYCSKSPGKPLPFNTIFQKFRLLQSISCKFCLGRKLCFADFTDTHKACTENKFFCPVTPLLYSRITEMFTLPSQLKNLLKTLIPYGFVCYKMSQIWCYMPHLLFNTSYPMQNQDWSDFIAITCIIDIKIIIVKLRLL